MLAPPGRNRAAYPPELDDRGLVFMRAGEPDYIGRCWKGEVWVYWARDGEGEALVTFFTMSRSSGARITFEPSELGCENPQTAEGIFQVLSHADARYARLMMREVARQRQLNGMTATPPAPSGAEALSLMRLSIDNLEAAKELAHGERPAAPAYAAALDGQFDFLHFAASRPGERATEVTLELGLPATRLRADTAAPAAKAASARASADNAAPEVAPYAARIALALTDSAGNVVLRHDTLRTFSAPADLAKDAVLPFHLTVSLPPGRYTYALRTEGGPAATAEPAPTGEAPGEAPREPGAGAVWRGTLVVPELPAPNRALRLSSIAIGRAGAADPWRRGATALGLIPTRVVPRDGKVTLYYELYGLGEGERYRTEIAVEKTGLKLFGRRTRLTLGFDEQARAAADGAVPTTRELDLARLERGDYRLRIRVRRADGDEEAKQETSLTLR